jgi:hypothetical protein
LARLSPLRAWRRDPVSAPGPPSAGARADIAPSEPAPESFFPADAATAESLRALADAPARRSIVSTPLARDCLRRQWRSSLAL